MQNKNKKLFDYEEAKQKVKEQLRSGKSLFGKGGAFARDSEGFVQNGLFIV